MQPQQLQLSDCKKTVYTVQALLFVRPFSIVFDNQRWTFDTLEDYKVYIYIFNFSIGNMYDCIFSFAFL